MGFDGLFMSAVAYELSSALPLKVDKVSQPTHDTVFLTLRGIGVTKRLLLSCSSDSPRLQFTETTVESASAALSFCMLLRKHLTGGRLAEIAQRGHDRIISLIFDCRNEMGDAVKRSLICEIMGRRSNIILTDESNKILGAAKHVDITMSSVRPVITGMQYVLPPVREDAISPSSFDEARFSALFDACEKDIAVEKLLLSGFEGLSPLICREAVSYACNQTDIRTFALTDTHKKKLCDFFLSLENRIKSCDFSAVMLMDENGKPKDYSFMPIQQYGTTISLKQFDSIQQLLDEFYSERDKHERIKQQSEDLFKLLTNLHNRGVKKESVLSAELSQCSDRDKLRIYGDLLMANLHLVQRGASKVTVLNFYDENGANIDIPLDPALTPLANAQRFYKDYQRKKTAESMITVQLEQNRAEISYIESVLDALARAENDTELAEIRAELYKQRYVSAPPKRPSNKKNITSAPLSFVSSDGFTILVGKNNAQNDALTLKTAEKRDFWFHVKSGAGSHVIVSCGGKTPPDSTLTEAAMLAAYYSSMRGTVKVPVDYTLVKFVQKPAGAKPGMVIYTDYQTAYVDAIDDPFPSEKNKK